MWQHLLKYSASFSITLAEADSSKYFTAAGGDLNFLEWTVPNFPFPISAVWPSTSRHSWSICFLHHGKTSLEFLILSFSFSNTLHISKYFFFIAVVTFTLSLKNLFSSLKLLITAINPSFAYFFSSLFLLLRDKRCLLLLSKDRLHFFFLKYIWGINKCISSLISSSGIKLP